MMVLPLLCLALPVFLAPVLAFIGAVICVVKERSAAAWFLGLAAVTLVGGWMAAVASAMLGGGMVGAFMALGCAILGNGFALEGAARTGSLDPDGVHPGAVYALGVGVGLGLPGLVLCFGGGFLPEFAGLGLGLLAFVGSVWTGTAGVGIGLVQAIRAAPARHLERDWS